MWPTFRSFHPMSMTHSSLLTIDVMDLPLVAVLRCLLLQMSKFEAIWYNKLPAPSQQHYTQQCTITSLLLSLCCVFFCRFWHVSFSSEVKEGQKQILVLIWWIVSRQCELLTGRNHLTVPYTSLLFALISQVVPTEPVKLAPCGIKNTQKYLRLNTLITSRIRKS
jgi:hypothetical protein